MCAMHLFPLHPNLTMQPMETAVRRRASDRMLGAALAALLAGLGAEPLARADQGGPPPLPREAYAAATELARTGAYAGALETLADALVDQPQNRPLLRLRGELLLEIRDFEGALAAYRAFLDAGPRGGNRRKAQRIVRDLQVVENTALEVRVENGPADIYLDSKTFGKYCEADPVCEKGMLPGRYRLFIERDGYEPLVERIEVALGETTSLTRTLIEKNSDVTIDTAPEDAEVRIDGELVGAGAQELSLEAGTHEIAVSREGFAEASQTIEAREGQPVKVEVALAELVPIEVSEAGATLWLDGEKVELDGGALALAPFEGDRELVARAEGFEEARVVIPANRPLGEPVRVTLVPLPQPAPPPRAAGRSGPRTAASASFAATSALGLAAAAGFGLHARSRWSASAEHCDDDTRCNEEGFALVRSAQTSAHRADVAFGTATAAAAVGAALWFLPESEIGSTRRYAIAGVGGAGIASFALAAGFGLEANARWNDAQPFCDVRMRCSEEGHAEVEEAKAAARRGNVMAIAGTALTATALGIWLYPASDDSPPAATVSAGPSADGQGASLTISGAF